MKIFHNKELDDVIKLKREFEQRIAEYIQQEIDKLNEALRDHHVEGSIGWCVNDVNCDISTYNTFGDAVNKSVVNTCGINISTRVFTNWYKQQIITIDGYGGYQLEEVV